MFDNPAIRLVAGILIAGVLFSVIMTLLPVYPLPDGVSDSVAWLFDTAWTFDFILPVQTIVQIIGIILIMDMISITTKIVIAIKNHSIKA